MPHGAEILGLKDYEIKDIRRDGSSVVIQAPYGIISHMYQLGSTLPTMSAEGFLPLTAAIMAFAE
jgi:hypothetical protein